MYSKEFPKSTAGAGGDFAYGEIVPDEFKEFLVDEQDTKLTGANEVRDDKLNILNSG
jgi:hypothetical protein